MSNEQGNVGEEVKPPLQPLTGEHLYNICKDSPSTIFLDTPWLCLSHTTQKRRQAKADVLKEQEYTAMWRAFHHLCSQPRAETKDPEKTEELIRNVQASHIKVLGEEPCSK